MYNEQARPTTGRMNYRWLWHPGQGCVLSSVIQHRYHGLKTCSLHQSMCERFVCCNMPCCYVQAFQTAWSTVAGVIHDSQTGKTLASCAATDCIATQTACMLTPAHFTTISPFIPLSPQDRPPAFFLGTDSENLFQGSTVYVTKFFIIVVSRNFYVTKATDIPAPRSIRLYGNGNIISTNQAIKELAELCRYWTHKSERTKRRVDWWDLDLSFADLSFTYIRPALYSVSSWYAVTSESSFTNVSLPTICIPLYSRIPRICLVRQFPVN